MQRERERLKQWDREGDLEIEESQTGTEKDKVDSGVDTGHGDDILLGRGNGLLDPGKRVPGVPGPRPTLPGLHALEDPVGVIHHDVAGSPRKPCEQQHQNQKNHKWRPKGSQERTEIHLGFLSLEQNTLFLYVVALITLPFLKKGLKDVKTNHWWRGKESNRWEMILKKRKGQERGLIVHKWPLRSRLADMSCVAREKIDAPLKQLMSCSFKIWPYYKCVFYFSVNNREICG